MTICRDWLSTLWPASFRGFRFFFESDDEEGGRGLVIHEFPHRDDPYVEDLGESPRLFEGNAYVHGDDADALAVAFAETLAARGPATLVIPIRGPVLVHCQTFRRHHEKDKLGYAAFQVKFVRDGAATALISVPFAANQAFGAADRLATALANLFPRAIVTRGEPDHVIAAAADGIATAAAALDMVRTSYPVDAAVSAAVRDRLGALIAVVDDGAIEGDAGPLAADLIAATRDLADGMPPATAVAAMGELAEQLTIVVQSAPYLSASDRRAADNAAAATRVARLAALTAFAEGMVRKSYASRPEGVTARALVATRFEAELHEMAGAETAGLFLAASELRDRVVAYLTHLITDLAPVVAVEAVRSMPSLFWAWRLYADPLRAAELVGRNAVPHPSFMPHSFAALAR